MKLGFALSLCSLLLNPVQQVASSTIPMVNIHHSAPPARIIKIIVKHVDFGMETWGRISCEAFDKEFNNANTTLIINRGTLDAVARRIAIIKPGEAKYSVDARAKLTIYYSDSTRASICMGGAVMEFNGKKVKYDPNILMLLGIRDS